MIGWLPKPMAVDQIGPTAGTELFESRAERQPERIPKHGLAEHRNSIDVGTRRNRFFIRTGLIQQPNGGLPGSSQSVRERDDRLRGSTAARCQARHAMQNANVQASVRQQNARARLVPFCERAQCQSAPDTPDATRVDRTIGRDHAAPASR